MNLIQKLNTVNTTSKKGRTIEYIVIHYTAGVSSSGNSDENTAAWFARSTTKASSDYIVDDDSVTLFNGDIRNRYSWHCGGSKYSTKGGSLYGKCKNSNSIGIEVCSCNSTGTVKNANDKSWYFTDSAINNTVELVKMLMAEYGIDSDHVIRHYDVTGKLCPGIVGWNKDSGDESKWIAFKESLTLTESADEPSRDYTELRSKYEELLKEYAELEERLSEVTTERDRYEGIVKSMKELCESA